MARGRRTDGFPADALISRHYVVYLGVWRRRNQGNAADRRSVEHISITATEDPFMGSGTTMAAAEVLGRIGYGAEISPGYCDVILRRMMSLTGNDPVHESGATFAVIAAERGVDLEQVLSPKAQDSAATEHTGPNSHYGPRRKRSAG